MIEIRKLDEDHWRGYRELRLEALKNEPIAFSSSYEEELELTENDWRTRINNVLFAISDNVPIGMIVIGFNNRIKTKHVVEIFGVYVKEKYRDRGIGKKLMDAAMRTIQENGNVSKVKLGVNPEQRAAVKLYEDCGFRCVGSLISEIKVDGKYYDEFIMEKLM